MRVTVVHGYYLHDSGSGVYVREVTRELVRQGHDVTLVCQERDPELYDFIDMVYDADAAAVLPTQPAFLRTPLYRGRCRLVRPRLSRLLVYVKGPFPGYPDSAVAAFHDCPTGWIDEYVRDNTAALRSVFAAWPPDIVLAHHAMMQPFVVGRASGGMAPYVATVHGSELNFSVKNDPRLVSYTLEGLGGAQAVVTISDSSGRDVVTWAQEHDLDPAAKTVTVPPGIDTAVFRPAPDRAHAIEWLRRDVPAAAGLDVDPEDPIIAFAGRLMSTKGLQHAVCSLPRIAERFPTVHLLVAGDGPARAPLERLAALLSAGDVEAARDLALAEAELQTLPEFGPVVPPAVPRVGRLRVGFLGHLTSAQLGRVFAAADLTLAPSVFPEALGLVAVEGLSAGALPVASYHSGLASVVDVVADSLADPAFRALAPGTDLTEHLAELTLHVLDRYPTTDSRFRMRLHDLCSARFPSWETVAARYIELATGRPAPGRPPDVA